MYLLLLSIPPHKIKYLVMILGLTITFIGGVNEVMASITKKLIDQVTTFTNEKRRR